MAMKVQVFFLVWHIVKCACKECSDSLGSCNSSPRASLMQTRSVNKQALSAVEASGSRTQTLAGYQQYTNNIVAKYLKDGESIDDEINTAIGTILTYIESMLTELDEWHNYDEDQTAACQPTAVDQVCKTTFLGDDVILQLGLLLTGVTTARELHKECRSECSQTTCSNAACEKYHNYRKYGNSTDQDAALFTEKVECAVEEPGKLSDPYIQADANDKETGGDLMLPKMENCLQKAKVWLDPLYTLYKACGDITDHCSTCIDDCNNLQKEFESKHCLHDTDQDIVCSAHKSCYIGKRDQCAIDCPAIELRARSRAADRETGERIKCLLGALRASDEEKPDELAACTTKEYTPYGDQHQYWLVCSAGWDESEGTFTNEPSPSEDCIPVEQPCGADFLATEYESLYLDTDFSVPQGFNMIGECKNCAHHQSERIGKGDDVTEVSWGK